MVKIVLLRAELFIEQGYFKDARLDMLWVKQLLNELPTSAKTFNKCSNNKKEDRLIWVCDQNTGKLVIDDETDCETEKNAKKNLKTNDHHRMTSSCDDISKNSNHVIKVYWQRRLLHLQLLLQHLQKPVSVGNPRPDLPDWTCVQQLKAMENKCYEMKLSQDRQRLERLVEKRGREIRSQRIQRDSLVDLEMKCLNKNDQLPGARQCLQIKVDSVKGRHVITNQPLSTGQVLFSEKSIVSWLRPSMYLHYCGHCLRRLKGHFVPCTHCKEVVFCNEKCRNNAWTFYHGQECSKLHYLRYLAYGHMTIRLLLIYGVKQLVKSRRRRIQTNFATNLKTKALDSFFANKGKLVKETSSETELNNDESPCAGVKGDKEKKNVKKSPTYSVTSTLSVRSKSPSKCKKIHSTEISLSGGEHDFKVFYSLISSDRHLSFEHFLSFLVMIGVLGQVTQDLGLVDKNEDLYPELCAVMFDCILKINFNCYLISDHKMVNCGQPRLWAQSSNSRKIGIGVYASSSMISHSCDCNSIKIALGSQIVIYSIKPLIKGEEVTITYGPHYQKNTLKDRRRMLATSYLFHCECNACKNGWENLHYAYRCDSCEDGAVVWFECGGGYCTRCEKQFSVDSEILRQTFERSENAQTSLEQALEALKARDLTKCKQRLLECDRLCLGLFYTNHKLYPLYSAYIEYYKLRHKFNKAREYARRMSEIQATNSGTDSLEWIDAKIQELVLLMREIQRNRNQRIKETQLKQLNEQLKRCEQLLDHLKTQEIFTAQRHYFDALPLSKALRKFSNEEFKTE